MERAGAASGAGRQKTRGRSPCGACAYAAAKREQRGGRGRRDERSEREAEHPFLSSPTAWRLRPRARHRIASRLGPVKGVTRRRGVKKERRVVLVVCPDAETGSRAEALRPVVSGPFRAIGSHPSNRTPCDPGVAHSVKGRASQCPCLAPSDAATARRRSGESASVNQWRGPSPEWLPWHGIKDGGLHGRTRWPHLCQPPPELVTLWPCNQRLMQHHAWKGRRASIGTSQHNQWQKKGLPTRRPASRRAARTAWPSQTALSGGSESQGLFCARVGHAEHGHSTGSGLLGAARS